MVAGINDSTRRARLAMDAYTLLFKVASPWKAGPPSILGSPLQSRRAGTVASNAWSASVLSGSILAYGKRQVEQLFQYHGSFWQT
mmetsp:Transcript_2947/g.7353  ORF Transcript_2947/g.7353 Transcript_2947/m.7353 type:complete len:85 (+) Transcript_2947:32-286(+)